MRKRAPARPICRGRRNGNQPRPRNWRRVTACVTPAGGLTALHPGDASCAWASCAPIWARWACPPAQGPHAHARVRRQDTRRQVFHADADHGGIQHHQGEGARRGLHFRPRLFRTAGGDHGISQPPQIEAQHLEQGRLVIHDEDSAGSVGHGLNGPLRFYTNTPERRHDESDGLITRVAKGSGAARHSPVGETMKLRIPLSLMLSAASALCADLPVKQVVLYKHGVGFFERSGTLGAGDSARLDFNATEMNDVLKSLTIGSSGGKITGLRYDSMDPLGHKLAEFPFTIGEGGMPGMLDQLKGARVELKLGTETVAGTIVSARTFAGTDKQPEHYQLNLMLDTGEFRTVDLGAATGLRFPDAKLQQQFKDYLAALSAARSKEKRSVYIDSTDAKERDVTASYMIPAPVWKSSYRLIFGDKAGDKAPMLEGWAIVDNTTGED